jgi:peptide/nickel transport system substrate-binding protein
MSRVLRTFLTAGISMLLSACEAVVSPEPSATPVATRPVTSPPPVIWDPDPWARIDEGPNGGQATIGTLAEVRQLHPLMAADAGDRIAVAAMWASVMRVSDELRYEPDLAVDIPTVDNGGVELPDGGADAMIVTWTLKPDLRWSDGEPLTCDDFRYTWEWVMDPANVGVSRLGWERITNFECNSAVSIALHFAEIYEGYLTVLTAPLPRHHLRSIAMTDQVQGAGFAPDDLSTLPVSGAFSVGSWRPGVDLTLVRNPFYRSLATGLAPHLDRIVMRMYPDPDSLIDAFIAQEVDLAFGAGVEDVATMASRGLGIEIIAPSDLRYEVLRMNWGSGSTDEAVGGCSRSPDIQGRGAGCPTADIAVRRAIELAIDKESINEEIFDGNLEVATSIVTPAAWFYSEQAPVAYDPAEAEEELTTAGWVDANGDGVRERDGLAAEIELCTTGPQARISVAEQIAAALAPVGIRVHVTVAPSTEMFAPYAGAADDTPCALSRGNFDLALAEGTSAIDPIVYLDYHSRRIEPNGRNVARIDDPEIDAALDTIVNTVNFVEIKDAMAMFQRRYAEIVAEVPLFFQKQVEIHADRLGNFWSNIAGSSTWNVADWFIRD